MKPTRIALATFLSMTLSVHAARASSPALELERPRREPAPVPVPANHPAAPSIPTKPNLGLTLGGTSLFLAAWVTELAIGFNLGGYYKIYGAPFAGPFLAARDDFRYAAGGYTGPLYLVDGIAQIAGVGLLFAGLLARHPNPCHHAARVALLPFSARGRGGVTVVGRF